MNKNELIREENRKIRRLQLMVDMTLQLLSQVRDLTLPEALQYIENVRHFALFLFPDKEREFELIYTPRFFRVLRERGLIRVGSKN